jgi:hypothetical protein
VQEGAMLGQRVGDDVEQAGPVGCGQRQDEVRSLFVATDTDFGLDREMFDLP